jgi:hypothetical protein
MNPIQASRSLRLTTSRLRLALALLSPFGALTMHAQTTLNDAQVIADLNKIAGDSTPEFPGTVGSPLFYVIGATGAYDTNLGEGLELLLYDYTTFTVQNGSAVEYSSGGIKARFSGDNNSIIVTGANSRLILEDATNLLGFRIDGTNSVRILAGGSIETGALAVVTGSLSLEIDGTDSTLQTGRAIMMWAGNSVTVDIANGGRWNTTNFSDTDGTLTLNLNDGGVLQTSAAFDASNVDTFSFNSGATLIANAAVSNLGTISSGRTVDISGGGSFGTATTLDGGTVSVGDFAMNNLTFTSGTLESTGILTGLTTLGSGATARVNGGSAVALQLNETLTLDGGTLEIANGASATPLGSGAIVFDATHGGEIALAGGTLNVASMSSALTLNANASITGNGTIYGTINLGTGGTIDGNASGLKIYGDVSGSGTLADLTLYGTLDIGNSPGVINLQGVTLGSGSEVIMEIMGTEIGEYDTLIGDAFTYVTAANLTISFSSFSPTGTESWQLISGDMDPLSFANINTPDGWTLSSSGLLSASAVPEPGTYALLAGLVTLGFVAMRRRHPRMIAR